MNKCFNKEVYNMNMQSCSPSLVIRTVQIEITMKYHFSLAGMQELKCQC